MSIEGSGLAVPVGGPASDGGAGVHTKLSPYSVAETVSRLEEVTAARGMKLFAVIDHSGEAHSVGLDLRDTRVVVFGSPQAGTPIMVASPLAASISRSGYWCGRMETRQRSATQPRATSLPATVSAMNLRRGSLESMR